MAKVVFTPHLERFLSCPSTETDGATLAEVVESVCRSNPGLRSYLLDDQGVLRTHVVVFVDGAMVQDRKELSDPVGASSEVYVMQALSGGQE